MGNFPTQVILKFPMQVEHNDLKIPNPKCSKTQNFLSTKIIAQVENSTPQSQNTGAIKMLYTDAFRIFRYK